MNGEVILSRTIRPNDVRDWVASTENTITFKIHRGSEFAVFAEAAALARIHELQSGGVEIHLDFAFGSVDEFATTFFSTGLGAVSGLFGVALILSAGSIQFRGVAAHTTFADRVWEEVMNRQADITSYLKRHVVFRDPDYALPKCLPRRSIVEFPFPTAFKEFLRRATSEIPEFKGRGIGAGKYEDRLLTFLYETARNSHEHARPNVPNRRLSHIRGITLEKRTIAELLKSPGTPQLLNEYLLKVDGAARSVVLMSVSDLGPGIQETLPSLQLETPWDRLVRAITTSATSKPSGGDEGNRGLGLPNVVNAAQRLRAFLFFSSAGQQAYADCSLPAERFTLTPWPEPSPTSVGTAISLLWPIVNESADQEELFPRHQ
ncbi:MAG TPA: hypothetical protein VEL28_19630 [Candidatus Binatia bacterium]|nr:hypothetical protein [Candidatus Binatia bacterium]